MKILITGTTGSSMPPPYGGIPKLMLISAREWKKMGNDVAVTFTYRPSNADDLGVGAQYFFEYSKRPGKVEKLLFLLRYFCTHPALYVSLLRSHLAISPHVSRELFLYTAYGVYLDHVFAVFKPDIVLGEAVLIQSFMAAEIARRRHVPIVFDVYAEVRDLSMGENKYLGEDQRKYYWVSFLNKAALVIGLDNCAVEMKAYLPPEKLKVFWDTCDYYFHSQKIAESRDELRTYFNLPHKTFLVGAVGSFELRKGHDHLISAAGNLAKKGYDVGVVICDDNPRGLTKWNSIAKEAGIQDRTYFFSSISELDLVKLRRSIDLYTNLSNTQRSCSLDLALMEGMASGLPIVVYDTGALLKAVPGEENGYGVPMNDIPAVSEAILKVYNASPEKRKAMGEKSAAIAATMDISITTAIKFGWFQEVVKNFTP